MDIMQSFAAGAQAVTDAEQSSQDYQSLIGSKQDLKTAYQQETKTDPETGKPTTPDPFKVQNLAAQFAASRGDLKSFELFNKQAQTYKQSNLVNQMKELEIQDNKIEKAHQTFQMMESPEDAIKEIMKADNPMPTPQKMAIIKKLKEVEQQGPEAFKKMKEEVNLAILPAKEAIAAKKQQLQLEENIRYHTEETARKVAKDKAEADRENGKVSRTISKEKTAEEKEIKKDKQADIKHDDDIDDKIVDSDNHFDSLRKDALKLKNEEQRSAELKKIEKDRASRKAALLGRKRNKPKEIVYKDENEIKAAYKEGKLTKEEATKLLREKHGYR
jgi:hypothetical protein